MVSEGYGQCTNSSSYGSATAPVAGSVTITTCQYAGEYAPIYSVVSGTTYQSTSDVATDFITIHRDTYDGAVVASGTTPLNWTAPSSGTYFMHTNTNSSCGTESVCRTTIITFISGGGSNPCTSITSIGGCGSGFTQTYTGGGTGAWNTSYCLYSTPGIEQVYSFVAPSTGTYSIGVSAATGYVDYGWQAGSCASTGWTCIDDIMSAGTYGSMSWTAGTTYYILLDDEDGTTGTHQFYINCPASCTTPGAPASVTGTSTGMTSANLSWAAGTPAGSATVTYYWVVGTSPAVTYGSGVDQGTTTSTSASTAALACNTTYYLRVYAYTSCNGTSSAYSTSAAFTTDACGSGPCFGSYLWLSADAPTDNVPVQVSSCNYAGEYNEILNVVAGQTYQFSSSVPTDWLTITTTANALLTTGTTPVSWVATFSGTVRCHIHTSSACGTESACRENYVTCTSCAVVIPPSYYIHSTTGIQSTYLGDCMVNLDCGTTMNYYDNGGPIGNYSNSINNIYRSFCPNVSGKCVRATMNAMNIEPAGAGCYDFLAIGNGPTQNVTSIWEGCNTLATPNTIAGAWNAGTWTSTDASGCLTFRFYSDGINRRAGWNITLSCVDCAQQNYQATSECEGSFETCGNTSFSGASTGPGHSSTCNGCVVSENYTAWYYFEITTSGTLGLQITPNNLGNPAGCTDPDDYDFALFRADDCSNLGAPVRCSYAWNENCYYGTGPYTGMANINANTGGAVSDQSEDVNGDGYVTPLAVTAGQTYFLMVNGWTPSDLGYNLTFQLSNGAVFTDCDDLVPLPVELSSFKAECNNDLNQIQWKTLSEVNNDYFAVMKSYNGFMFKTIGWVIGQGNSNEPHDYSFVDEEKNEGKVYYQLKQYDFDGNFKYSEIISANCNGMVDPEMQAYFKSNEKQIDVTFSSDASSEYTIQLIDLTGKVIYSQLIHGDGTRLKHEIESGLIPPALYLVRLISGNKMEIKKIVVD